MIRRLPQTDSTTNLDSVGEQTLKIGDDNPIRISAGHRILHHDGKCSRPHGHNYKITVEITGTPTAEGWIIDKGEVTSIIEELDHRFIVEEGDPLVDAFKKSGDEDALVVIEHPPTAEVLSAVLKNNLHRTCPDNVSEVTVKVRETGELCAVY